MSESIVTGLVQNVAILLAFAMLYENFWLRYNRPPRVLSNISAGFILGGIGAILMFTTMELSPGLVFDTRSVMLVVSGLFFGAIPTVIAMAVSTLIRFIMGGDGMWMGIAVILMSGTTGIIWGKFRLNQQKVKIYIELLVLGIIVHLGMLGATFLLPSDHIVPTLTKIALPVMLIHVPGTILLGMLLTAQKRNSENLLAKEKLYEAENKYSKVLLGKQKQLHRHVKKYAQLARKFKSQNSELKVAKEKAEESDRLKSSFLANLSHEIRTPMNAIIGFSDLLEVENIKKEQRDQYLHIIRKSSDYLLSIINDIIEISHIESRQVELKATEIDPAVLLNEICRTLQYTMPADSNVKLVMEDVPANTPSRILIDEVKLKQILVNLINNAFKFTPEGEVRFGCYQSGNRQLAFFVKDTGIGIEKKYQGIIFERFRQVENSKMMKGGSGLGLAIVKAYCELMGGSVSVESEPGKGSTFTVVIPYNLPKGIGAEQEEEANEAYENQETKHILVAEDEDVNWMLIDEYLSPGNYRLVRAVNGHEAVEICRNNNKIDLVLMDIKMPGLNGYEAREEIRKIKPHLPVIAQTAYALPSDVTHLKRSFSDYITKPINRKMLLEKISAFSAR